MSLELVGPLTPFPDPEEGPLYVNPQRVQAVMPSSPNPEGYDFTRS
jgi:hypothetical protein